MIDFLFQIGFSNTCLALLLATLACLVSFKSRRPHLAHLLWLLVLIKLVTPPIYNMPIDLGSAAAIETNELMRPTNDVLPPPGFDSELSTQPGTGSEFSVPNPVVTQTKPRWSLATFWTYAKPALGVIWLVGSLILISISLVRVVQFHRLLLKNTKAPTRRVTQVAKQHARRLGLRHAPLVSVTSARISPMVWWVGGLVHVVMPESMFDDLEQEQWQWVLAHEMAHVRRRDYLVRWLEWFACVSLWWNPLVWCAQRNLRATEEVCCDELVIYSLNPNSHSYAQSILAAVESLVCPAVRPPAMASEINSGGFLERRIEMILSPNEFKKSRSVTSLVMMAAMLVIPLGIINAQDFDALEKRLAEAVTNEEVSLVQAAHMMEALHEAAENTEEQHNEWKMEPNHDPYQELKDAKNAFQNEYQRHENNRWFAGQVKEALSFQVMSRDEKLRLKFESAEEVLTAMLKARKITSQDMKTQLAEFKTRLMKNDEKETAVDHKKEKYESAKAKYMALREREHIMKGQDLKKLDELAGQLWPANWDVSQENEFMHEDKEHPEHDAHEKHDDGAEALDGKLHKMLIKIKTAVSEGKISREDAKKKIDAILGKLEYKDNDKDKKKKGNDGLN